MGFQQFNGLFFVHISVHADYLLTACRFVTQTLPLLLIHSLIDA
nr:MAG TPA: hypothetical protein [Caudoviricetes sp.]